MYTYYDVDGNESSEPIDNHIAFKVTKESHTTYFVKRLSSGALFDPAKQKDFGYLKQFWKFRKVNPAAFDYYVRFLKTKHRFLLTQSERTI
jgi:hypothetical protein